MDVLLVTAGGVYSFNPFFEWRGNREVGSVPQHQWITSHEYCTVKSTTVLYFTSTELPVARARGFRRSDGVQGTVVYIRYVPVCSSVLVLINTSPVSTYDSTRL